MPFRPALILSVLAALFTIAVLAPPEQAAAADRLAPALKVAKKGMRSDVKAAYKLFDGAVDGFEKRLKKGTVGDEEVAQLFGNALIQFVRVVKEAGDDRAEEFLDAAAARITATGDVQEPGTQAGDGGSFDALREVVQKETDRARKRAVKRARKFMGAIRRADFPRVSTRVRFHDWDSRSPGIADLNGVLRPAHDRPALWVAVATRLSDGRVMVSVAGAADPTDDNLFDLRMAARTRVVPIGELVTDGGLDVDAKGTFGLTVALGNPQVGDGVDEGSRVLNFGRQPEDDDVTGLRPTLIEHAGYLSIP